MSVYPNICLKGLHKYLFKRSVTDLGKGEKTFEVSISPKYSGLVPSICKGATTFGAMTELLLIMEVERTPLSNCNKSE